MKLLIPIKRVVDHNVRLRVASDHAGMETAGAKMSMNPFDEIATEEAVRLKERGLVSEIIAISAGPAACAETLRTALALGADRAILVETTAELQPLAVARLLGALVARENPDLVLMGKQAIDDDMNATAQILAGLLGWPQATFASRIECTEDGLVVEREVDGGRQTLALPLPAVVSVDLRLNEPRYASLPNIMRARKKPMDSITPADLGVDITPRLRTVRVDPPPTRQAGRRVASVAELVRLLRDEAAVI